MLRSSFALLAAILLGSALAQQPPTQEAEPLTPEQRIENLESRWDALEKSLSQRMLADSPTLSSSSLESRLSRLEARLQRLEQQSLRASGPGSGDRFLESRVRALEREVAQLRRR